MAEGKDELFAQVFPPLFDAALSAHDRLREQLRDRDKTTALLFATEPVADLFELSGYAIIYGELDTNKGYWEVVKPLWEEYFANHPDPARISGYFNSVVGYREARFVAISPRDLVRASWKQDLERRLRERDLIQDELPFYPARGDDSKHPSELIRVLTRGRYMFQDPHDVFLAVYFSNHTGFDHLELPSKAESLADKVYGKPEDRSKREADEEDPPAEA